jgi:histidyl-tRNA synthetase
MSVEGENRPAPLDLFVAPLGAQAVRHAGILARELRRAGYSVELVEARLKRAMELANKAGARFTLIIGEDEMNAGRYALKNMTTGDQQNLTRDEILAVLAVPAAAKE